MASVGPATLFSIALEKLIRYSNVLGDIGSAPLDILEKVLIECSPETLSRIESETRKGVSKRDISGELWPLWYIHVRNELRNTIKKNDILRHFTMPGDDGSVDRFETPFRHLVDKRVKVLDYEAVFKEVMERKRARLDNAGRHVRQRFQDEKKRKESRCVKVIDPLQGRPGKQKKAIPSSSATARLSQKLGIKPAASHGMRPSTFKRNQKSIIKKHRSQERRKTPTVLQLKRQTTQQSTASKPSGTLSEASIFPEKS